MIAICVYFHPFSEFILYFLPSLFARIYFSFSRINIGERGKTLICVKKVDLCFVGRSSVRLTGRHTANHQNDEDQTFGRF